MAYTKEPGLIGSLQIGFLFANALSISLNKAHLFQLII
ncbi:hypothetical protein [Mycoplasmopsis cynos]|nr:hypothetical protein [Mycoplasmopsis cynos]UWV83346.1 hypothetical protein NW067_04385 [Mycoplasmopsis cynos]